MNASYETAPAERRIVTISVFPRRVAHATGVAQGLSSGRLVGEPRDRRKRTIPGLLFREAHPSGVEEYWPSLAEMEAPASSSMAARREFDSKSLPCGSGPH